MNAIVTKQWWLVIEEVHVWLYLKVTYGVNAKKVFLKIDFYTNYFECNEMKS